MWGAQTMIGVMYHEGKGVPVDQAKAVHWLTKAAKQRNAPAQFNSWSFNENFPWYC